MELTEKNGRGVLGSVRMEQIIWWEHELTDQNGLGVMRSVGMELAIRWEHSILPQLTQTPKLWEATMVDSDSSPVDGDHVWCLICTPFLLLVPTVYIMYNQNMHHCHDIGPLESHQMQIMNDIKFYNVHAEGHHDSRRTSWIYLLMKIFSVLSKERN